MTIQYNARLELDGLADALAVRGLSPGGKVQKFIDSEEDWQAEARAQYNAIMYYFTQVEY